MSGEESSLCRCLFCLQYADTFTVCWAVFSAFSSVNLLYEELILPATKHVWCWWWSCIKKKKIVTESQEACQVEQLNQEQNLSQGAVAILKSLSSKHLAVSLGVELVLLPKIATSVRSQNCLAFFEVFVCLLLFFGVFLDCTHFKEIWELSLKTKQKENGN